MNIIGIFAVLLSLLEPFAPAEVIEVPFEFYRNQIMVQVMLEGKGPFNMLLDTGTDPSAIDLATAREIGLKLPDRGHAVSGGGTTPNAGYETKFSEITLGDLKARNISVIALDLSKLSSELGRPTHGVLGHSLLNGRTVQIDYPKRIVRFFERPLFGAPQQTSVSLTRTTLRFHYNGTILIDDAVVNGRKVTASIDTGSTEAFQLTPSAIASLGLQEQALKGVRAPSVGYNGIAENTQGTVESVSVGTAKVNTPTVVFFAEKAGHDKEKWGLNIGNGFLKDFVLTIDYRNRILALDKP